MFTFSLWSLVYLIVWPEFIMEAPILSSRFCEINKQWKWMLLVTVRLSNAIYCFWNSLIRSWILIGLSAPLADVGKSIGTPLLKEFHLVLLGFVLRGMVPGRVRGACFCWLVICLDDGLEPPRVWLSVLDAFFPEGLDLSCFSTFTWITFFFVGQE